jgi:prevent-host-death family protein
MSKRTVGARELKTRLGQYLQRVRQGETLVVTDRSEPIAELRPIDAGKAPVDIALRKLATQGLVTLPSRRAPTRVAPARVSPGASASAAIVTDRAERG